MRDLLERQIDQALGRSPADLVIRNARILNLVTGELRGGRHRRMRQHHRGHPGQLPRRGGDRRPGPFRGSRIHRQPRALREHAGDSGRVRPLRAAARRHHRHLRSARDRECSRASWACNIFSIARENTALDLRVQLSSCVPATNLETSGARLTAADLVPHRHHPQVIGLAEFMNVPGVLNKDPECMEKLAAFHGQHIDGHAPLLSGHGLNAYLSCGIRNCHETTNLAEGREKLAKGMQVLIREGSVSKDLAALCPLINEFASPFLGLCTDDRNPLDIHEEGHLDYPGAAGDCAGGAGGCGLSHRQLVGGPRLWAHGPGTDCARLSGGLPAAGRSGELRGAHRFPPRPAGDCGHLCGPSAARAAGRKHPVPLSRSRRRLFACRPPARRRRSSASSRARS